MVTGLCDGTVDEDLVLRSLDRDGQAHGSTVAVNLTSSSLTCFQLVIRIQSPYHEGIGGLDEVEARGTAKVSKAPGCLPCL